MGNVIGIDFPGDKIYILTRIPIGLSRFKNIPYVILCATLQNVNTTADEK